LTALSTRLGDRLQVLLVAEHARKPVASDSRKVSASSASGAGYARANSADDADRSTGTAAPGLAPTRAARSLFDGPPADRCPHDPIELVTSITRLCSVEVTERGDRRLQFVGDGVDERVMLLVRILRTRRSC
jgi:hypothetical protein